MTTAMGDADGGRENSLGGGMGGGIGGGGSAGMLGDPDLNAAFRMGLADLAEALRRLPTTIEHTRQVTLFGYRRSVLGEFWLTFTVGFHAAVIIFVFSRISDFDIAVLAPWVAAGLVLWQLISEAINTGTTSLYASPALRNEATPSIFRWPAVTIARCMVTFLHNLPVFLLPAIVYSVEVTWASMLVLVTLPLVLLVLWAVITIIALAAARFRDIAPLVVGVMRPMFFMVPVMWHVDQVRADILKLALLNPLACMIALVREPLQGRVPGVTDLAVVLATGVVAWALALYLVGRFRGRVCLWL